MQVTQFHKVADILSRQHRITVKEGQGWAANIKNKEVFYQKEDIYTLAEDHILGLLLHEIAHIHYTTDVVMPKKNEELLHSTLNMLEDISIEHIISGDYPNAGLILESTETELLDTLVRMLPKMNQVSIHEKALLYGAVRFRGRGYAFGFESYERLGEDISQVMKARSVEIYDRKQTKELLPLAQTIVDMIIKAAGEPTEEEKQQMKQGAESHTQATQRTETDGAKKKTIQALGGSGYLPGSPIDPSLNYIDEIADQAGMIGKLLRSVLKRNNAMEFGGRYRTGKLMTKRIVRVRTNKDRRPFGRRIVKSNQSYAFAVASDVSGSMFNGGAPGPGKKWYTPGDAALTGMWMLAEALRKANVPRSLIVFGGKAQVAVPMNKQNVRWDQIANKNILRKADNSSTEIHRAMNACMIELSKVRAERKIMVILTDGASDQYWLQQAYKEAKSKGIECIAITIGYGGGILNNVFEKEQKYNVEPTDYVGVGKAFISLLKTSIVNTPQ